MPVEQLVELLGGRASTITAAHEARSSIVRVRSIGKRGCSGT